jgi:hypothetical protein
MRSGRRRWRPPAILAIEAAGREPVAVAAVPVVEVAPPVVGDPVPVVRAVKAPTPATVRELKPPKAKRVRKDLRDPKAKRVPQARGSSVVVEDGLLPVPSQSRTVRGLWGTTMHRLVARVAQGQLLGDAMDSEEVWLVLSGHAAPVRVVGHAGSRARRTGLVGADGRITAGGSAWLENLRRRNERVVKVEAIRPVDDARVPALREAARLRVGGRQRLYGTMMHRMLSRLHQGQEVDAAKAHEAAYLLRTDLRLRPMCSAANAVNMLRRKGLIDASFRVSSACCATSSRIPSRQRMRTTL